MESTSDEVGLVIVAPVYNDWDSALQLLSGLDRTFATSSLRPTMVFVDDASIQQVPHGRSGGFSSIQKVERISLWRNCGHQRAIAIGLCHCHRNYPNAMVLVMDCDGEDRPEDGARLVADAISHSDADVVFAERRKRQESTLFRIGYWSYRQIHYFLTGIAVRVGNFSVIRPTAISRVVHMSDLWNHYAACVFKSRVQRRLVPIDRGTRYSGRSTMNLTALVAHGFSALSVFREILVVRLLTMLTLVLMSMNLLVLLAAYWCGFSPLSMGLVAVCVGGTLVAILNSIAHVVATLSWREMQGFLPVRDYMFLVKEVGELHP